jgi:hypothetical protein
MDADTLSAAVEQCERHGVEITVANVAVNVALKPGDYNALLMRGLRQDVRMGLKRLGYITNDVEANTKVAPERAKLSDLEELLEIKERNDARVHAQTQALRQLVEYLRVKAEELGYDPYVYQFEEDARRIYQMHGLDLPTNWGRGLC